MPQTQTHREQLLGDALRRMLVRVNMIAAEAEPTGPELLVAAEDYLAPEPIEPLTAPVDVMPRVNGKPFRCTCGCNVFRQQPDDKTKYVCNSCQFVWVGEE